METDDKMFFYEKIFAKEFDAKMNQYDLRKRLSVIYEELLTEDIGQKRLLDAGCGTGWFSKFACDRGAFVTSMDLGENLLHEVSRKCSSERVVGSILEMPFQDGTFDYVVCSEVIEHVPDPQKALFELHRVLKRDGILVLTTPNRFWYFSLVIANFLKIRPYQGLENWLWYKELKRSVESTGFSVEKMFGIHLFPFIFSFSHPLLDFFHRYKKALGPIMVNSAIRCRKIS